MKKSVYLTVFVASIAFFSHFHLVYAEDSGSPVVDQKNDQRSDERYIGHGVVNKLNVQAGKVNISHDPIPSIQWPKMTMDFNVKNKTDLTVLKSGMSVDFELTRKGKSYLITHISPSN